MMVINDADSDAGNDNGNDSDGWSVITGGWLMKIIVMIQPFMKGASHILSEWWLWVLYDTKIQQSVITLPKINSPWK